MRPERFSRPFLLCGIALWSVSGAWASDAGVRTLDPERTVYLELEGGDVVIELAPAMAPKHVARFRELVADGFYDGKTFYRVIDGFVAQGGDGSDLEGEFPNALIDAEFERELGPDLDWTAVETKDPFAPETGFIEGFAAGRDVDSGRSWLVHCPGVVAMARNNAPDTASTDFYIVIGQAPRYLDRNMSIFGRVVAGMQHVQRIARGPADGDGVIEDEGNRTAIVRARLATSISAKDRLIVTVPDSKSDEFKGMLESRRHRTHEFFHVTPPPILDVCQIPLPSKVKRPGH